MSQEEGLEPVNLSRPVVRVHRLRWIWALAAAVTDVVSAWAAALVRLSFLGLEWIFTHSTAALPFAGASLGPLRRVLTPLLGGLLATWVVAWRTALPGVSSTLWALVAISGVMAAVTHAPLIGGSDRRRAHGREAVAAGLAGPELGAWRVARWRSPAALYSIASQSPTEVRERRSGPDDGERRLSQGPDTPGIAPENMRTQGV